MRALIEARPEMIEVETTQTALIINDMQNAFCSSGGYIDKIGFDISGVPLVVERIQRVLTTARALSLTIIHLQNGFSDDLVEAPGPSSPLWRKSNALRYM
jgi:ureidoacrylate peracid hydrolase